MSYLLRITWPWRGGALCVAVAALFGFGLLVFYCASAGAEKEPARQSQAGSPAILATSDGLGLVFDTGQKRFTAVVTPDARRDLAGRTLGVFVFDHQGRVEMDSDTITPAVQEAGSGRIRLVRQSKEHALKVAETWTAKPDRIELQATITHVGKPRSRPIEACLSIPLDLRGKLWHHHLHLAETISEDKTYATVIQAGRDIGHNIRGDDHLTADQPINLHGLNLVSDDRFALALAMQPDKPAAYYVSYDATEKAYLACFHLGIYAKSKRAPTQAELNLTLFTVAEPKWGMRAALQKYFALYPEAFGQKKRGQSHMRMIGDGRLYQGRKPDNPDELLHSPAEFHVTAVWNTYDPTGTSQKQGVHQLLYLRSGDHLEKSVQFADAGPSDECMGDAFLELDDVVAFYAEGRPGKRKLSEAFPMACGPHFADCRSNARFAKRPVLNRAFWVWDGKTQSRQCRKLEPTKLIDPLVHHTAVLGAYEIGEIINTSAIRGQDGMFSGRLRWYPLLGGYTFYLKGIDPDPGIGNVETRAKPGTVRPTTFGALTVELAKIFTGGYGKTYSSFDARYPFIPLEGIAVDTVGAYLRPNFHPDMLAMATTELSHDRQSGAVVSMEHLGLTALLGAIRRAIPEQATLGINGMPISGTLGQHADYFLRELGERLVGGGVWTTELYEEPVIKQRRVYRIRMVAYQRPITFWARFYRTMPRAELAGIPQEEYFLDEMRFTLPLYTALGIYIYIQETGICPEKDKSQCRCRERSGETHCFGEPFFNKTGRSAALLEEYKRHLSAVTVLNEAGWEPLTWVTSPDPDLVIERFGQEYVTVYNTVPETRKVELAIESGRIAPERALVGARDMEGKLKMALDTRKGTVTIPALPPHSTVIVQLEYR